MTGGAGRSGLLFLVLCLSAHAGPPVLGLRPFGVRDPALLQDLVQDLRARTTCRVLLLPPVPLPGTAYYPPRARYRAERLLEELDQARWPDKLVGLTTADISTTKGAIADWGIFGLGSLGGRSCVVSTFRLGAGGAGPGLRRERLRRVVRHEVLHTFGLDHCPQAGCLMEDARGTIASVDRGDGLPCPACRAQVPGLWR